MHILAASFMLPKYLLAYTPMSAKSERDMYKSSVEKIIYKNRS